MSDAVFDPTKFVSVKERELPIFFLLDRSGSMNQVISGQFERTGKIIHSDGKDWHEVRGGTSRMDLLNNAIQRVLITLKKEEVDGVKFLVTIITFSDEAEMHMKPSSASEAIFSKVTASGETSLGKSFDLCKDLIEDKSLISSRSYRPTVILVSDGRPTDDWRKKFDDFINTGRSAKCDRMAMAVGDKADTTMLGDFLDGTCHELHSADNAEDIHKFFQKVTMSVSHRSKSQNPNELPDPSVLDLDDVELPKDAGDLPNESGGGEEDESHAEIEGYW